jgi:hypothetical protein
MTTYILTFENQEITRVKSERAAKTEARAVLGSPRISEYPTEDGWCYYPAGDVDDNGPIVCVTIE